MSQTAEKITPSVESSFTRALQQRGLDPLRRDRLRELQINVGRRCNQACHHCHVDAGPKRTEIMAWDTMEKILRWAGTNGITAVDITGGAPELNPHFRRFVEGFLTQGTHVTVRCNLTVLLEPGQEDLAAWYAQHKIRLVCSLPCYTQKNVDAQRGDGVFDKSIEALKQLNAAGYGRQVKEVARSALGSLPSPRGRRDGDEGLHPHSFSHGEGGRSGRTEAGEPQTQLVLDLVYNPGGAFLPGAQEKLEADYKQRLKEDFGVVFSRLMTITNLPINRFAHFLDRTGQRDNYLQLLEQSFNPATIPGLMCRHLVSVDWHGRVYDCDFNQMLDLPLGDRPHRHLWDIIAKNLTDEKIAVDSHCLGCTAGAGSSCGGALA